MNEHPVPFAARVAVDGTASRPGTRRRRWALAVVLALVAVVAAACRVSGGVVIEVAEDGSGRVVVEVRFDAAALERLGDPDTAIRTEDLEAAGWRRHELAPRGEDTVLAISKRFAAPGELQAVLAELGPGTFEGFTVGVEDGFASTSWTVEGRVTVRGDLAAWGDDALAEVLDGHRIGWTPEELAEAFGGDPTVPFDVAVWLPPDGESATLQGQVDLATGGEQQLEVSVRADRNAAGPLLLFGLALALAVAAATWRVVVVQRRRRVAERAALRAARRASERRSSEDVTTPR